jgi:CHAT domain-containing protein
VGRLRPLRQAVVRRPLAEAQAAWRSQESKLLGPRGDTFTALPGTRLEARLLRGLVPSADVLLGSAASQQNLDRLAATDALKRYRLLHLATHGQAYHDHPEKSALSLVADSATALLMMRFYQNLLGKRAGLKKGMPRAVALHEAKTWLRKLTRGEAEKLLAGLLDRVARGERASIKKALVLRQPAPSKKPVKDERPFAAPYFWAAFVLIGEGD